MTAARNERQNPSRERSKHERPPRSPLASRNAPTSASRTSSHAVAGIRRSSPVSGVAEIEVEKASIDLGQRGEVGELDLLVDLVHGQSDETKLDDRAIGLNEPRIRCASSGAVLGASPSNVADRLGEALGERTGCHQKSFTTHHSIKRVTAFHEIEPLDKPALQPVGGPAIVEADVEDC